MRVCERLVGLGDVEVLGVGDEPGEPLRVHIRRRAPSPDCEVCGGALWSDGERQVGLVDLPAFGRPARLVWHKRRWRCPQQGCSAGTVTEQDREIAPPREKLTARAGRWATRQAGRARPVDEVAAELGCSWHPGERVGAALGLCAAGRRHRADLTGRGAGPRRDPDGAPGPVQRQVLAPPASSTSDGASCST